MPNPTTHVKVTVPKRSGFLKSFQNILTTKVGTLTPVFIDELIPGSKANVRLAAGAQLPPMATDVMMRCSLRYEAFFVPHRILVGSFENFFSQETVTGTGSSGTSADFPGIIPTIYPTSSDASLVGPGSLSDYLGARIDSSALGVGSVLTSLPFLAYHKIWNDWYRRSDVQKPCFRDAVTTYDVGLYTPGFAPHRYYSVQVGSTLPFYQDPAWALSAPMADGVSLGALRQRNFDADYFTVATASAQAGDAQKVEISIPSGTDTSGGTTGFTIAALRAANSLQLFEERNNLPGDSRYVAQLYARYGAKLSNGVAQRPLFLGSAEFDVYSKGIYQGSDNQSTTGNNPFNSVATKYGDAYASGSEFIVKGFTANEPGYLMILVSLVPRVNYSSGVSRLCTRYIRGAASITDMANPLLQSVGNQPIYGFELNSSLINDVLNPQTANVFGYVERYADWKNKLDEVHGLLVNGQSLASFVAQRTVTGTPTIGTSFLEIPTNYLDGVTAVSSDLSQYGVWIDNFFDYRVSMPLQMYSIPSLEDPSREHGHSITLRRGGYML